ncbi:hypothetical protein M2447_001770 [Ereboglobus sp. PH5-10]|uniref:FAD-dependent oxidoreductase n=1 Tax=Ereboglobus sp. PH5-10 TaxID=2940629 RepID=UPI002404A552|nr:FAD-dependent oxidoreductase [Ereboglobus sp. PH5-10]MDF9827671.1 hypothetical protein [Ereboglobus sp. PH5-10]
MTDPVNNLSRRTFLQTGLGAGAVAWASIAFGAKSASGKNALPGALERQSASTQFLENEVDVLVVGGGTAGHVAAIQAARAGAKTLLVERSSMLGGTMTLGGVAWPGIFHAWGRQIIGGFGWELVKKAAEFDGDPIPDFTVPYEGRKHWQHQIRINQHLYALLAEEAVLGAGAELCYYEFPAGIRAEPDGWVVATAGPGVCRTIRARQLVDATGGADIAGMAGLARLRENETQPGSILYKAGSGFIPGRDKTRAIYVHGADSSSALTRTRDNQRARSSVLKRLRAIREKTPEKAKLTHLMPEVSIRESWRIDAEYNVTVDDYRSGRKFPDAVCNAFYPVDLHTKTGVRPEQLGEGTVPTIPRRALIPKGGKNILVAGRSVGSDRLANSGFRVQAPCMAMGQAAGAIAALAARKKCQPLDVPFGEVRALLEQHGAVVP